MENIYIATSITWWAFLLTPCEKNSASDVSWRCTARLETAMCMTNSRKIWWKSIGNGMAKDPHRFIICLFKNMLYYAKLCCICVAFHLLDLKNYVIIWYCGHEFFLCCFKTCFYAICAAVQWLDNGWTADARLLAGFGPWIWTIYWSWSFGPWEFGPSVGVGLLSELQNALFYFSPCFFHCF